MKRVLTVLLLAGAASQGNAEAKCTNTRLQLRWETGHETFSVEVADETAERDRASILNERLDGLGRRHNFAQFYPFPS